MFTKSKVAILILITSLCLANEKRPSGLSASVENTFTAEQTFAAGVSANIITTNILSADSINFSGAFSADSIRVNSATAALSEELTAKSSASNTNIFTLERTADTTKVFRLAEDVAGGSLFTMVDSSDVDTIQLASGTTSYINTGSNFGVGTTAPVAPLQVGAGASENSVDSVILIARDVDDTVVGNGHAFSDSSDIDRSGDMAYNSFDCRVQFLGEQNYNHYAAFQVGPTYASTGTLDNYYGYIDHPTITTGNITNRMAASLWDITNTGGTVVNNYGLFVKPLVNGANNYAIYTDGSTESYFGGDIEVNGNLGIGTSAPLDAKLTVRKNHSAITSVNVWNSSISAAFDAGSELTIGDDDLLNYLQLRQSGDGAGHRSHIIHRGSAGANLEIESKNTDGGGIVLIVSGNNGLFVNHLGGLFAENLLGSTGGTDVRYSTTTNELFYDTSSLKYKENIDYENVDTSWLHDIKVAKYDRKDGSRQNEIGIIAEDLTVLRPDYVSYKVKNKAAIKVAKNKIKRKKELVSQNVENLGLEEIALLEEEVTIPTPIYEPESYSKSDLVPILINELQILKKRVDVLEAK